jgi:hypothetical protein
VPIMGHGDAERMYDACVLAGLNPVPWQFEFLRKIEQQAIDEQFSKIVRQGFPV